VMWVYAGSIGDWLAARVIDSAMAGGQLPGWAPLLGIAFIVAAAVTFTWMVAGWWLRRRLEREQPPPGNLLDEAEWLADRTEEIPAPPERRYRGRRRAPREPRKRRPRPHLVPAHPIRADVAATQLIGRIVDDVEATAVLARPRDRWGAR
jgi:hypothetical protein